MNQQQTYESSRRLCTILGDSERLLAFLLAVSLPLLLASVRNAPDLVEASLAFSVQRISADELPV